jgi:hypothetical protein
MKEKRIGKEKTRETHQPKRPFAKSDFEAVLKSAIKPLKKEQGEKESEETSESHHSDGST